MERTGPTTATTQDRSNSKQHSLEPGRRLADRFEVRAQLGAGSTSRVYSAYDTQRRCEIALKLLGELDAAAISQVKQEFRTAADLVHPNLVRLHELFCDGGLWFYTMDKVNGVMLPEALRPGMPHQTFRHVFTQLATALDGLHQAGSVHRDLKPSNFLINPTSGKVTLLDFGLARPVSQRPSNEFVGTPEYMAPEQQWGKPIAPAADWYSFGVVLHEALTGSLPEQRRHSTFDGAPAELAALCIDLLQKAPENRPDGAEVLRRLSGRGGQLRRQSQPTVEPFLGRAEELQRLTDALEATRQGRCASVLVEGASGIGKTALVEQFIRSSQADGVIVLASRCRERESISYKAADGVIDRLIEALSQMPSDMLDALLDEDVAHLCVLFPALRRMPAVERRVRAANHPLEAAVVRMRAIEAFGRLLARLRRLAPVVIWIDDLQWSDRESAALFEEVLCGFRQVSLMFIGSYRHSHEGHGPLLEALFASTEWPPLDPVRVDLQPLNASMSAQLVTATLASVGASQEAALDIAREAEGHPLFAKQLAYARVATSVEPQPKTLSGLIRSRLSDLTSCQRAVLEVVSVAKAPLTRPHLRQLCDAEPAQVEESLDELRSRRLIRSQGLGDADPVDIYHDRIAEIVVEELEQETLAMRHRQLAQALTAMGSTHHESIAMHLEGCGEHQQAAHHWLRAADRAMTTLAFGHAAALYERGATMERSIPAQRKAFREQQAQALANAGQGPAAAAVYVALSRDAGSEAERLSYVRLAAEQLLYAGRLNEGFDLADQIARSVGLDTTRRDASTLARTIIGRLRVRARGFRMREAPARQDPNNTMQVRLDLGWMLSSSLSLIDPMNAIRFHNDHLLCALDSGDPLHSLRALTLEVPYVATLAGGSEARCRELLEDASRLANAIDDDSGHALLALTRGVAAYLLGHTEEALVECDRALDTLAHRDDATWETLSAHRFTIASRFLLGRFSELARWLPPLIDAADDTGNNYASMCLRSAFSTVSWLVQDGVAEARRQLEIARAECTPDNYHLGHYNLLLGELFVGHYEGEFEAMHDKLLEQWPLLAKSMLLRIGVVRAQMLHTLALSCCDAAIRHQSAGDREQAKALLKRAQRSLGRLRHTRVPRARALGLVVEAAMLRAQGKHDKCRAVLTTALGELSERKLAMYATAVRWHLAHLDTEPDEALAAQARREFEAESVAKPKRMARMLFPGFSERLAATH